MMDMQHASLAGQPIKTNTRSKSIYVSHFISTWNSRGFEFGAILFLSNIFPGTLLQMSIYALLRALTAIVFSPAIGRYIDRGNRLVVVRNSIVGQRLAVTFSCTIFLCLLLFKDQISVLVEYLLFVCLVVLACVEKLCIIMNTISVERDWVVVVSDNNDALLQNMNSHMRRIDLFCKLISPLAIALLDGYSSAVALIATLVLNATSVSGEYFLISWVYQSTTSLSERPQAESVLHEAAVRKSTGLRMIDGQLKAYVKSSAFLPSLSLSLLFLTVLSFSGQMITYLFALDKPRLTSIHIGIMRTIATILEISSTFIAPVLINRVGAVRAGIWSLSWQFICLSVAVLTFWTPSERYVSTYIFVAGIMLSRIGLWSFDLIAQLLVQNSVDAGHRGSFSATESSVQNFFELCTFAMTIVWSSPDQFEYPATISLGAVFTAAACYARYVRLERGHLLHLPICCGGDQKYKKVAADETDVDAVNI